jgi:hypothetical protein
MKRLFIGSLLTLGVAATLASCNNGAYDANPKKDLQGALNPLADTTGKGTVVYIGTMRGYINGGEVVFSPAYYKVSPDGVRSISAWVQNDSVYFRNIMMDLPNDDIKGLKDTVIKSGIFTYSVYDTVRKVHKKYTDTLSKMDRKIKMKLYADENNTMRGYFTGTAQNVLPLLPPPNPNDITTFKDLAFYLDLKK